jgi:hypothetical protein
MIKSRYFVCLLLIFCGCHPGTTTTYILKNESTHAFQLRVKYGTVDQTISFQPDEANTIAVFDGRVVATVLKFDSIIILPPPNLKALKDLKAESAWTKEDGKKKNGKFQAYYNASVNNGDFK